MKDRTVLKIDPSDCRIVATLGRPGWGRGEFLWPTAVADMGFGQIIVSDAHTGRLTTISTTDMSVSAEFGANGPGAFNMPYGVAWHQGKVWVASTFNRTFVELADFSWETARFYPYAPQAWAWHPAPFPAAAYLSGETRDGYRSRIETTIQRKCYVLAYAAAPPCNPDESSYISVPDFLRGSHFYFVQGSRHGDGVVVSSPQNAWALFYADRGGPPKEVEVGLDAWVVDGRLVGPKGPVSVTVPPQP